MANLITVVRDRIGSINELLNKYSGKVVHDSARVLRDADGIVDLRSFEGGNVVITRKDRISGETYETDNDWTLLSFPSRDAWHKFSDELSEVTTARWQLSSMSYFPQKSP
jgi:hypothetical protein